MSCLRVLLRTALRVPMAEPSTQLAAKASLSGLDGAELGVVGVFEVAVLGLVPGAVFVDDASEGLAVGRAIWKTLGPRLLRRGHSTSVPQPLRASAAPCPSRLIRAARHHLPSTHSVHHTRPMAGPGYDSDFLDTTLAPPEPGQQPGGGPGEGAGEGALLDYQHFTVRMHPTRRLAWWVAWNIDGLRLFPSDSISRSGEDFRADPRIPATAQTLDDAYAGNRLDRGHVARRSDLLWGTLDEARTASSDSFFFTNITPQMDDFNQSGRGGAWGLLENAVLAQEGLEDRRLTLFGGPVLREDDPAYRDIVQVPREHWKVVVYRMEGRLRSKSFVLSQDLDLDGWDERTFLDDFDTYLVPLDFLEVRTGLAFASLRASLPAAELRQPGGPVLVADAEQVAW